MNISKKQFIGVGLEVLFGVVTTLVGLQIVSTSILGYATFVGICCVGCGVVTLFPGLRKFWSK